MAESIPQRLLEEGDPAAVRDFAARPLILLFDSDDPVMHQAEEEALPEYLNRTCPPGLRE
jgi:hypothetical protein